TMREHYLLRDDVIFLNHGSFGACPKPVFERYQAWQRELEAQPVEFLGRRHDDLTRDALATLGNYLGTDGSNLVFVPNATTGLNMVARSLELDSGDEVLTTDLEYGALDLTWGFISEKTGCEIVSVALPLPMTDADAVVEAFWAGVTERTKVIFLSHITSATALLLPIEQICTRAREAGILTIIDGAHVPGQIPLDLEALGADIYSGNLHKWLSAPKGSAFVYIHPDWHAKIDPLVISWGSDGDTLFERTRWQGTRDIAAFLTVPEAIAFQHTHDWDTIRERCHALAVETVNRVCDLTGLTPLSTPDFYGQLVAIPLPDTVNPEQLKHDLYEQFRVEVPITTYKDKVFVRISIAAYNTPSDIDALIKALEALL
ncbi:MAG: aminotransferase class V-fold PLP-dependent enzyme, partial [Chloroflexota bacterium]